MGRQEAPRVAQGCNRVTNSTATVVSAAYTTGGARPALVVMTIVRLHCETPMPHLSAPVHSPLATIPFAGSEGSPAAPLILGIPTIGRVGPNSRREATQTVPSNLVVTVPWWHELDAPVPALIHPHGRAPHGRPMTTHGQPLAAPRDARLTIAHPPKTAVLAGGSTMHPARVALFSEPSGWPQVTGGERCSI